MGIFLHTLDEKSCPEDSQKIAHFSHQKVLVTFDYT